VVHVAPVHQIRQPDVEDRRQRVNILNEKDLDISYFCGSGAGGQARNKVHSGVQIIHRETGAIGRASDSRSQADNKQAAFRRLLATPKMKFWLAAKVFEVRQGEKLEDMIAQESTDEHLKYEIKNGAGRWEEVPRAYFDTEAAKENT
jgi:protein subunit release factor B